MNFKDLINDEALLKAVAKLNWQQPTLIQQKVIPLLRSHQNMIMQADICLKETSA